MKSVGYPTGKADAMYRVTDVVTNGRDWHNLCRDARDGFDIPGSKRNLGLVPFSNNEDRSIPIRQARGVDYALYLGVESRDCRRVT